MDVVDEVIQQIIMSEFTMDAKHRAARELWKMGFRESDLNKPIKGVPDPWRLDAMNALRDFEKAKDK